MTGKKTIRDLIQGISPDERDEIFALIGEWPAAEVANMTVLDLVKGIVDKLPDDSNVAGKVLEFLRELEVAATGQPDQMDYRKLLTQLASDPSLYRTDWGLMQRLWTNRVVMAASARTELWAISSKNGINLKKTFGYLEYLGNPLNAVQRGYEGARPTTLAKALGIVK